jgi:putative ABC transport system permease protein
LRAGEVFSTAAHLARRQLLFNRVRLVIAIAGIAFADLLMFMQIGFRDGLFRAALAIPGALEADLVVIDPDYQKITEANGIPRHWLYRAFAVPAVESVSPVFVGTASWRNPMNGRLANIVVIGVDPVTPGIAIPAVLEQKQVLSRPDGVLFDVTSRPRYGPIADLYQRDGEVRVAINRLPFKVGGLYRRGKPFDYDGAILMGEGGFLRTFENRQQGIIDFGLVRLRAGSDPEAARQALLGVYGKELDVLTKAELLARDYGYWNSNAPIGFIFNLGTAMGFLVGIVIVYQILFTDVAEHLPEYATLKAMGHSNTFLFSVVGCQAVVLAIAGFIPGALASAGLYNLTAAATSLPIMMTAELATRILLLTILMCALSGGIALYKVAQADPADVFG